MAEKSKNSVFLIAENKKFWAKLLGFFTLFILLSFFVPFTMYEELGTDLNIKWSQLFTVEFILACFTLLLVYYISDGLRLWFTLRSIGCHQSLKSIWPLVFINLLFSNITPMATGGGVAQVWFLHRRGVKLGTATAATSIRTLLASLLIFIPTPFLFLTNNQLFIGLFQGGWGVFLSAFACCQFAP